MSTGFITVREAAETLGVTEQHVRRLIRSHELPGERVGGRWLIPADVVEEAGPRKGVTEEGVPDNAARTRSQGKWKALSFFSGAMGLDIGLEQAGIETLLACEVDKAARATIARNRPDTALIGDIREYSASEIRRVAGLSEDEEVDLVVGGPPCQAFSSAGRRQGFNDERGNVFLTFIERIIELRPRYAVIENVRGLLSAALQHRPLDQREPGSPPLEYDETPGGALFHVLTMLRNAGYGVSFNLYNSANFGTPQKRERVILVCSRDGERLPYLSPTHDEHGRFGLPTWNTVRQAISDLQGDAHEHINFPEKRLKYYRLLGPGQYWRDLPSELQPEALGNAYYSGGGKTGFLRRVPWDEPSPTLVTHPAMPATDLAHPELDRPLSVQEYKRIQEFPDEWVIEGKTLDKYRQIGNAVPCSLGRAIGNLLMSHAEGKAETLYPDFPFSRYKNTDDVSWEQAFMKRVEGLNVSQQDRLFDLLGVA